MQESILGVDTVSLDEEKNALVIVDQTRLPGEVKLLSLTRREEIFEAIASLRVRGAPAIGVAAAIGIYLAAREIQADTVDAFYASFMPMKAYFASARPTAVNLFWALDRMERVVLQNRSLSVAAVKERLHDEAVAIRAEDIAICHRIGENGLSLLRDGCGILTHCNAGQLAAVRYGTALAPIHLGRERGWNFHVFCDETRPLLQGSRLSAFELAADGVDTTVICDSMAAQVMKNGWVDAVLVGADRIAANGDVCNKIGTSGVAILAKHYGIPFYVCAPVSTIDITLPTGEGIPIEQRAGEEITQMWYKAPMAPQEVKTFNPAFDVTDASLVTGIVTEYGVLRPDYGEAIQKLFAW